MSTIFKLADRFCRRKLSSATRTVIESLFARAQLGTFDDRLLRDIGLRHDDVGAAAMRRARERSDGLWMPQALGC